MKDKEKQIKIKRGELVDLLNQEQEELQKASAIEEMAKVEIGAILEKVNMGDGYADINSLADQIYHIVLPEDSVVLSVNDWINFNKEHANELIKTREEEYGLGYNKGSKETAEKFAKGLIKIIKEKDTYLDWDDVLEFAKEQFGVEIGDEK